MIVENKWVAKTDQTSRLDGRRVYLNLRWWKSPKMEHGMALMLFDTRRQCRDWIKYEYGYLKHRPDLRAEPHCWRMPKPVRVTVEVTECTPSSKLTPSSTRVSGSGGTKPTSRMVRTRRK